MSNQPNDSAEQWEIVRRRGLVDPVWWIETVLGRGLWSRQRDILLALRDNKHVAVKSCNAAGKSYVAACAVHWYLYNHRPSIVITTAPTQRQVRGILWKEIRTAHLNSRWELGGKLMLSDLSLRENWFAMGFTAAEYNPDKFQGFHESDILIIVDESCGISTEINEGIDAVLTSERAFRLDIGNPTDSTSEFAKLFKTPNVCKTTVSAFDTPNFTAFGITQTDITNNTWRDKIADKSLPYPALITPEWVADRWRVWGIDNPIYLARVLAQFPTSNINNLIPLRSVEAAQQREIPAGKPIVLGVDVARYGDDRNAIYVRRGGNVRLWRRFGKTDTMTTAGLIIQAARDVGAESVHVDVIGVGAGVYDRLNELRATDHTLPRFIEANAGAGACGPDSEQHLNARAEWYMTLRDLFERGEIDIDSTDEELAAELVDIRWRPDSRGRNTIEPKEEMKRRLGRSPDSADAVAMAFMPTVVVPKPMRPQPLMQPITKTVWSV